MRYLFLLLSFFLLIIGCQKEEHFPVSEGDRLVRYLEPFGDDFLEKNYFYDEEGKMTQLQADFGDFHRAEFDYLYNSEGLLSIALRNDTPSNGLNAKMEFFYDEKRRLVEVISYTSSDSGLSYQKTDRKTKFHYDEHGNLFRKEVIFNDSTQAESQWVYFGKNIFYEWEDGNIIKEEYYNVDNVKAVTKLYQYDNKSNFRKNLPPYITLPLYQTKNNVLSKGIVDHLGFYPSLSCNPCKTKYHYNRNGKPIRYYPVNAKDLVYKLTYE